MPSLLLAVLALFASMATCVESKAPRTPDAIVRSRPTPGRIVHVASGSDVSFEAMMSDLFGARAVYVAERHDDPLDHAAQYTVLRALHADASDVTLAMEMFQAPYQDALDRWVAGRLDEGGLLAATDYAHRWGYDVRLYRPILEYARAYHVPIVALNAPSELSRAVATDGLAGLPEAQSADLPEMDLAVADHRALVEAELREHPDMTADRVERYYEAQVLWDETMAEGVARTLSSPTPPSRVLVMAGRLHILRGLGIPARAHRRGVERQRIVIPLDPDEVEEALAAPAETPWGDYLWVHERGR